MESKVWWQSKSIWLNIILGLCSALVYFVPALKSVQDWIGANGALIGSIWGVLGVAARAINSNIVLSD